MIARLNPLRRFWPLGALEQGLFAALTVTLIVLGAIASPVRAEDSPATVELIGIYSGFAKARVGVLGEHRSITVAPLPEYPMWSWYDGAGELDAALDARNRAANWQIFLPVPDEGEADVVFDTRAEAECPSWSGGCTTWVQFPTGWYRQCIVHVWDDLPPMDQLLAHELGHCLGFRDVTEETEYLGIMSYHRATTTMPDNNDQDPASLAAVGYVIPPA